MSATIWVKFIAPGFHSWPDAPQHRAYLASRHRHLFHVTARLHVEADDREIEFHDLLDEARACWPSDGDLGSRSCEAMARTMAGQLAHRYARMVEVEVSEDGEAGASVICP